MLKNRHFISYFSTTLLYVTAIGLFLYIQQQTKISTERSQEKVMQVLLSDFMPEILPVEETPVEKEVEELIKRWLPHMKIISPSSLKEKINKDLLEYLKWNQ